MTSSSALMAISHILLCYILFFSFNKPFGYGSTMVEKNKSHAPPSHCTGPTKGLGVVHKYGPCSPFGQKKSVNSRSYNRRPTVTTTSGEGEGVRVGTDLLNDVAGGGNFLVRVGFGTPVQYLHLTLDTGSYVTWVRCQRRCTGSPCEVQQYDPSSSSTSSDAPCGPSTCNYTQKYVDNSYSEGFFMVDTLTIENKYKIPRFVFLCSNNEHGDFDGADGILGLGLAGDEYGSYSLTSQTTTMFHNVFCHCLPSSDNSKGSIYFGKEAYENCPFSGDYTPLLNDPSGDPSLYFVKLIAITIGQKIVRISSFGVSSSPGTIMDSGTMITRLPESVYSELSSEFRRLMTEFPRALPHEILDTCYDLTGYDNPAIPNMMLHFANLDVNLDQTEVTMEVNGKSQVCLAFAKKGDEDDSSIIGYHQQKNRNILYNIPHHRLEIGPPGNC